MKPKTPEAVGIEVGRIPVQLSTRFLEHFSEQLYSSPQKAFEELVSNGWDAGANIVDVRVDTDLQAPEATMAVFDNGASMNLDGLRDLWHIAFSPKEGCHVKYGRPLIGKFGIGKLATYVLAERLTYICKASDGIIRSVTMNYGDVDSAKAASSDRLINDLELAVFEVDESDLSAILDEVYEGAELLRLIHHQSSGTLNFQDTNNLVYTLHQEEFGGAMVELTRPNCDTWTLVILSNLKPTGRNLKIGILRRMLAAALPFASEMAIYLNGDQLTSTKMKKEVLRKWVIGSDLKIDRIELDDQRTRLNVDEANASSHEQSNSTDEPDKTLITVKSSKTPFPHIELPHIGTVTGLVQLFDEKLTGGKSDQHGSSNGFHVNILGRVVNLHDPSCGEKNLNHAAWARFRMTVRADGLNKFLTTNREQFKDRHAVRIFRAFLRKAFNKARNIYDSDKNAMIPHGGDVLVKALGVVSLNPLRSMVSEALRTEPAIPGLFDETGIVDRQEARRSWRKETGDNIKNALGKVAYERLADDSFVKFRIKDSSVVVNRQHPFVVEHSRTKAEKDLIRTIAMIDLLADLYALDIGVDPRLLDSVRTYRDRLMHFRAVQRRRSGVYIAQLLKKTQHDSGNSRLLEAAVCDALRYLDFEVRSMGGVGEPDGIAKAFATPTGKLPTSKNRRQPLYTFSFDTKSSKHKVAKTGNISLDAVVEHRDRYGAHHAMVVAPGFSDGALGTRCRTHRVTPMTTGNLANLLEYTVKYGAIPVTTLRGVFELYEPDAVSDWVSRLADILRTSRNLTIDIFIRALEELRGKVPDALSASTVALICRENLSVFDVQDSDIIALAKGIQVIVPDLVGVDDDKIVVNASAVRVAEAISVQLDKLQGNDDDAT